MLVLFHLTYLTNLDPPLQIVWNVIVSASSCQFTIDHRSPYVVLSIEVWTLFNIGFRYNQATCLCPLQPNGRISENSTAVAKILILVLVVDRSSPDVPCVLVGSASSTQLLRDIQSSTASHTTGRTLTLPGTELELQFRQDCLEQTPTPHSTDSYRGCWEL